MLVLGLGVSLRYTENLGFLQYCHSPTLASLKSRLVYFSGTSSPGQNPEGHKTVVIVVLYAVVVCLSIKKTAKHITKKRHSIAQEIWF